MAKIRTIVFDISNILFRVAATQKSKSFTSDPEEFAGLCMHISLNTVKKWFNKFKPKSGTYRIVFAFDGGNNWRKTFTAESARAKYKSNRVYDPSMQYFYDLLNSFIDIMTTNTSIITFNVPKTEADDAIAVFVQEYSGTDHEIYIISGDKDFIQLLRYENVHLINPDDGKERNQPGDKIYWPDLDYYLFEKCVRGDAGDNVLSAYPRVRKTKIEKAYNDEFFRVNFFNETWSIENDDGSKIVHRVGDIFEENKILVDLRCQPKEIRDALTAAIKHEIENPGKYNNFHFLKFLGKYKLNNIAEHIVHFTEMFACNQLANKAARENAQAEAAPEVSPGNTINKSSSLIDFD